MFIFVPEYEDQTFKGKHRLIYYSEQYIYENKELQKINEFKVWAHTQSLEIPDCDEEILRHLYA